MYKCRVKQVNKPFSKCVDDEFYWVDKEEYRKAKDGRYARLVLLEQVDSPKLKLDQLKDHGMKAAPQGPIHVSEQLAEYMNKWFNDYYCEGYFQDIQDTQEYHEGIAKSVKVNKYERSSVARKKCIEYHGMKCLICGIDFSQEYGKIGEGFIHVHHMKPISEIGKDYVVDYKNDLIPVCPNCHAMIHRLTQEEASSVASIRAALYPGRSE